MLGDGGHEAGSATTALPALGAVATGPAPRMLTPLANRVVDALGLRAWVAGVCVALGLIVALVAREAWLGRLDDAIAPPASLHVYLAVVEALLIGYLLAARVSTARAARATLDALGDALDLPDARRALVRGVIGCYRRERYLAAGAAGAVLGILTPLLVHDVGMDPWNVATWTPEVAMRRCLAPIAGWFFGTYVLATYREAQRVSDLAAALRSIDLFDGETVAPFGRFGLQVALRAAGLVSVTALMVTEGGFGHVVALLMLIAAGAAAAGLLLPVRGLRERICEEKRRELTCCREALRRARDAMLEGRTIVTEHGRLSEVVAYKQLVEAVDEWPVDTPTVLRACGYVGLPVVSWMSGSIGPDAVVSLLESLVR